MTTIAERLTSRTYCAIRARVDTLMKQGRIAALTHDQLEERNTATRVRRATKLKARSVDLMANVPNTRDAGYVIGVLYGDGFVNFKDIESKQAKSLGLTTTDESFRDSFVQALGTWVGETRIKRTEHVVDAVLTPATATVPARHYTNVKYFNAWFHDRYFVTSLHEKFGPTQTETWCIDVMGAYARGDEFCKGVIQGLFDSDGSISTVGSLRIQFGTISRRGAASLTELLWMLGYDATVGPGLRRENRKPFYTMVLNVAAAKRYCAEIGSRIGYKSERMNAIAADAQRKLGST